jgi:hypothetical protein
MAIRSRNDKTAVLPADDSPGPRSNPEIEKKIDIHIAANQGDFEYYNRLVTENPERAVRTLILKDQRKHEADMKLVMKQLPGAKEFYEKQSPETRARIDHKLQGVNPYYHDKAFVGEVLREMDRQNRMSLASGVGPKAAPAMSAG